VGKNYRIEDTCEVKCASANKRFSLFISKNNVPGTRDKRYSWSLWVLL